MTATLSPATRRLLAGMADACGYDADDAAGEPVDVDAPFSLGDRLVALRDTVLEWKSPTVDVVRSELVSEGDQFDLAQVWRPDQQAMLRDDDGFPVVVGLRQLAADFALAETALSATVLIPSFEDE